MTTTRPYIPGSGHAVPTRHKRGGGRKLGTDLRIWWNEIDRTLLVLIFVLMGFGLAAVAAASPASARRLSTATTQLPDLYFYYLNLRWQVVGIVVMLGASMLPREMARRLAILLGAAMLVALTLVPLIGTEVNGARRWLNLGMAFQPSEFLKPAFAIVLAWVLSWRLRDPNLPVIAISSVLFAVVAALLMVQPNLGDTILFAGVWFLLVFLSGLPMQRVLAMGGIGLGILTVTYFLYDNARHRIDAFLGGGTAFDQVDLANRTLVAGGWTGSGLWLGIRKLSLPEAHTDYIFSVIGEEFGLLACMIVIVLYLAVVVRVLVRTVGEENLFAMLASAGLVAQVGGQAFINILVNLQLFPSKGMTLPLISYGGSSTVAMCLTVGFLLAITRRNPYLPREKFAWREALSFSGDEK
ncbi:MAG: cell division protein FtsW [Novosphingobium sp.]|nr:cell division protein FtsW [Novosphingobium sp.]